MKVPQALAVLALLLCPLAGRAQAVCPGGGVYAQASCGGDGCSCASLCSHNEDCNSGCCAAGTCALACACEPGATVQVACCPYGNDGGVCVAPEEELSPTGCVSSVAGAGGALPWGVLILLIRADRRASCFARGRRRLPSRARPNPLGESR